MIEILGLLHGLGKDLKKYFDWEVEDKLVDRQENPASFGYFRRFGECPLFPKAVVQIIGNSQNRGAAFGQ